MRALKQLFKDKAYFSSIHWKIQLWYGAFLLGVLAIILPLAITTLRETTFRDIDQKLLNQIYIFTSAIHSKMEIEYAKRKQQEMRQGHSPYEALHIITRWEIANDHRGRYITAKKDISSDNYRPYGHIRQEKHVRSMIERGEYFVTYTKERDIFDQSPNAPSNIPVPPLRNNALHPRGAWSRGPFREVMLHNNYDYAVVIGADLRESVLYKDYLQRVYFYLISALCFYLISFLGGWFIIQRALTPIRKISDDVHRIAKTQLKHRIDSTAYSQEFHPLSQSLNNTFGQLEATFTQQKEFTQDASHELKTPVAAILSQTEYSLEKTRDTEHYIHALEVCQRNAGQMKDLIAQLLHFSQFESIQSHEHNTLIALDHVALQCIQELQPIADQKHITMHHTLTPSPIYAPNKLIHSLISNLLSNAIRYNQDCGHIEVSCQSKEGKARLEVRDTGIGIPASELDNIFLRFYRLDKSRSRDTGSSGLGLAIVKEICDLVGAVITAESTPGTGSCFTVTFNGTSLTEARSTEPNSQRHLKREM